MQELVQQIARQRDMFRKLLQDAANDPARAAAAAADLQLIAAADARAAQSPGVQVFFHHPAGEWIDAPISNGWQTLVHCPAQVYFMKPSVTDAV